MNRIPSLTECCWDALGYSLGVIVEACIQYQSGSSHTDPIYVSANYLRATNPAIGQVRVKLLKSGKTFTNILAELVQQVRVAMHCLPSINPSRTSRKPQE